MYATNIKNILIIFIKKIYQNLFLSIIYILNAFLLLKKRYKLLLISFLIYLLFLIKLIK